MGIGLKRATTLQRSSRSRGHTSGRGEIASPAPSYQVNQVSLKNQTNDSRGTKVTSSDDVPAMSYHAAMDAHAREYLTRVLILTGGERQRAAKAANLNRTHLQLLLKRYNVTVPPDLRLRGRRRSG